MEEEAQEMFCPIEEEGEGVLWKHLMVKKPTVEETLKKRKRYEDKQR